MILLRQNFVKINEILNGFCYKSRRVLYGSFIFFEKNVHCKKLDFSVHNKNLQKHVFLLIILKREKLLSAEVVSKRYRICYFPLFTFVDNLQYTVAIEFVHDANLIVRMTTDYRWIFRVLMSKRTLSSSVKPKTRIVHDWTKWNLRPLTLVHVYDEETALYV